MNGAPGDTQPPADFRFGQPRFLPGGLREFRQIFFCDQSVLLNERIEAN